MTTIKAFVKRHPMLSFFALVFTIGWGGILILAGGPGGIPTTQERFLIAYAVGDAAVVRRTLPSRHRVD
jgi:hypothetical protein